MAEQIIKRKVAIRPETTSRPKAKVNSSAQIRSKPATASRPGTSDGPTPRANSPAKFFSSRPNSPTKLPPPPRVKSSNSLSPPPTFQQPKLRTTPTPTIRTNHSASTPTTPESRNRAHTSASSDVGRFTQATQQRLRRGSVSLHHAVSFSSFQTTFSSARSASPVNRSEASPPIKIKSKVTTLAKPPNVSPSSINQPHLPFTRSHTRVPSTSSSNTPRSPTPPNTSSHPSPIFYPITTANPAANPHRYISRGPPQTQTHQYHHIFKHDYTPQIGQNGLHKVDDPAMVPLPPPNPNSPPASAVSFSSRSSVSRSSASVPVTAGSTESLPASSTAGRHARHDSLTNGDVSENLLSYLEDDQSGDGEQPQDGDADARKVKAEAKSIRKIADLEITNRSLLAINASLESAKHRQSKEIRELRRKLRESRLILPPRAYRAIIEQKDMPGPLVDAALPSEDDDDDDEDEDNDDERRGGDEAYKRVKVMLEGLLESGKRALERRPADLVEGSAKVTVLSADEVRSWQDSTGEEEGGSGSGEIEGMAKGEGEEEFSLSLSPSHVALPDGDTSFDSEDEVEMSLIVPSSPLPSFAPPILITDSH